MPNYNSFNPLNFIICGGDEHNEKIEPASDTVSVSISQMIVPRRGAYGCGNLNNSWIIAGFNTDTVERFDHSNFNGVVTPTADLPGSLAGGASLYGNEHAYLCGSAYGPESYIFSMTTETGVATNDMPLRVRDCEGSCDTDTGWCVGGVKTDGTIHDSVQKIVLATSTWSQVPSLEITGGKARHNSHYRNHTLYLSGGIESNGGLTSKVVSLDVSTDVATVSTRCELSLGRDFVAGINNLASGWNVGGSNQGSSKVVDKFDFANDTTNAQFRTDLNYSRYYASCLGELEFSQGEISDATLNAWCHNGERFNNDRKGMVKQAFGLGPYTICDRFYFAGGQNYDVYYTSIDQLEPTSDTITVEANNSLTARYSLIGFGNQDYSWFATGMTTYDGDPTNITERLDHSNTISSVVPTMSTPTPFGNGSVAAFENTAYAKAEEKTYQCDMTTGTWTSLPDYGMEIFQAGCGIGPYALFAGGTVGSARSNDVYKFDPSTGTWSTAANILLLKRSGAAASANAENVWLAGGSNFGPTPQIEKFDVYTSTSVSVIRSNLASSKQRLGSSINQDHIWYTGGFRSGAIDDIERYSYFDDTVVSVYRGSMSAPRHSFGQSGEFDTGTRTFADRMCRLYTSQITKRDCCYYGTKASTDIQATHYPIERMFDQRYIRLKVIPWQELSQRKGIVKCGELHSSTISVTFTYATNTSLAAITSADTPHTDTRTVASSHSYISSPYQPSSPARVWLAGGPNELAVEVMDQGSGWTPRCQLSEHRSGAAGISSIEEGWFAGGSINNIVEHLDYSNDTVNVTDVADLSIARSYLMATHNFQYGWLWSGEKVDGNLTGVIDRLDKSNYTLQAVVRTHETGRKGAAGDMCCSRMYGIGGKNHISNLDHVISIAPENDTTLFATNPFPKAISAHTATSWDDNCIYLQSYKDIWKFNVAGGVYTVEPTEAYYRTNGTSFRTDDTIILAGGNHNSHTKHTEKYNPSSGISVVHGETSFYHNNSWCVGERAFITEAAPTRQATASSWERHEDELTGELYSVSAGNNLLSSYVYAAQINTQREGMVFGTGACAVTKGFGKTWLRSGVTNYVTDSSCSIFSAATELPVSSNRSSAFTNADYGWFVGGGNIHNGCRISYWDDTTVTVAGPSDDKQEFAGSLSQGGRGLLVGGVSNYSESNILVGTNAIRALDFSTDTWTAITPYLSENFARGAVAKSGNLGYLLGGNRGANWIASDTLTKMDLTTDTNVDVPSVLPTPADLLSAVTRDDGNITLNNTFNYYPATDVTVILPSLQPFTNRFGSTFGANAHEAILVGGKDQRYEDALITGDIYSGGNSITEVEHIDYSVDLISTCPSMSPSGLSECAAVTPYSFCFPEGRGSAIVPCVLSSYGNYVSSVKSIAYKDYTFTDLMMDCECQERLESTLECTSFSVEEGVRDGIISAAETQSSGRQGFIHNSVDPYNDDKEGSFNAADTKVSDVQTYVNWEQLGTTVGCRSRSLEAERLWSTRQGFLYSGGPFNQISGIVPLAFDLEWSYTMQAPTLEILSKVIDRGDLEKILEKAIFEDPLSIDIDQIIKDLMAKYPDQRNVVYLVENKESTVLNEDILMYQAIGIKYITLVMNTSDPYFLFRISDERDFKVTSDKEYFVNGSKIIPMIYGTQIIRVEFEEPIASGDRINLELKSRNNSLSVRLISL